jgi:large subunit ribosomal protein L29
MKGETKIGTMADWTLEERVAKEKEWRQALFTLRLQKATGQLDNPMKIKSLRRDIARLKTLASQGSSTPSAPAVTEAHSPVGGDAPAAEPAAGSEVKALAVKAAKATKAAKSAKPGKKAAPSAKKAAKAPAAKPASKAKPGATAKAKA